MAYRARFLGLFLLLLTASSLSADIAGLGSNVTGRWTVKISVPGAQILGIADLTQSGNQVTGWLEPNGGDRIPVSGALISNRLIITTHPESRHIVAFDRCEICRRQPHERDLLSGQGQDRIHQGTGTASSIETQGLASTRKGVGAMKIDLLASLPCLQSLAP
jgi:hypothetical protein